MVWGVMSASGFFQWHIVPQGTTINAHCYVNFILQQALLSIMDRESKNQDLQRTSRKMVKNQSELAFVQDIAPGCSISKPTQAQMSW